MNPCPPVMLAVYESDSDDPDVCRPAPTTPIGAAKLCPVITYTFSVDPFDRDETDWLVTVTVVDPGDPLTAECMNAAWPGVVGAPLV
jgi:hypothetical protein